MLRSFPATPTMVTQRGTASAVNLNQSKSLRQLTQWTYGFTYSLPYHYPQDWVYCNVAFNVQDASADLTALEDSFNALAEFATVYPQVRVDLFGLLAPVDTSSDAATFQQAAVPLKAFRDLLQMITLPGESGGGEASLQLNASPGVTQSGETYAFYIQESATSYTDDNGVEHDEVLLVSVFNVGEPPEHVTSPPQVVIAGWNAKVIESLSATACYVYEQAGEDATQYLTYADSQSIADRQVLVPDLDSLAYQDAEVGAYIKRNAELVPGKPSADELVYQTAEVGFPNPCHPSLDSDEAVDIATLPDFTAPQSRTLRDQLQALFDTLLANNTQSMLTFQLDVTYTHTINTSLDLAISLPVVLQPPWTVDVSKQAQGSDALAAMLDQLTRGIKTWADTHSPSATAGVFNFDLRIMSNLTAKPMPLLRLRALTLLRKNITDLDAA